MKKGETLKKIRTIILCFTSLTTIVRTKLNSFTSTVDQNSEGNIVEPPVLLFFFFLALHYPGIHPRPSFP